MRGGGRGHIRLDQGCWLVGRLADRAGSGPSLPIEGAQALAQTEKHQIRPLSPARAGGHFLLSISEIKRKRGSSSLVFRSYIRWISGQGKALPNFCAFAFFCSFCASSARPGNFRLPSRDSLSGKAPVSPLQRSCDVELWHSARPACSILVRPDEQARKD